MLPGVQDAVLAYARSYAGKLEAQREEEEKEEKSSGEMVEQEETLRLAEDKRKSVVEDQELGLPTVMAPGVDIPHASVVDEEKNQLGPSRPSAFSLLDSPSTPRSTAQKVGQPAESPIPEAKKLKPTIEKLTHGHEGVDPDPKRAKQDPTIQHERRVTATQVGTDVFYHMDSIIGEEELVAWQDETHDQALDELPDALWSHAPLDRVPPEPPKWIEDIADAVEEARLQKLGVLSRMDKFDGQSQNTDNPVRERLESKAP